MGPAVEPHLRRVLEGRPSAEVRRRAEILLEHLRVPEDQKQADLLRRVRAVQVLEYIGTAEAQQALQTIAKQAPLSPTGQEAKASVERLERRNK
jgi:hypothetical protein